MKCDISTQLLA